MKWEKVKLGELYEVHNGLSKAGKFFGEGYPFLTFSTVFNNYFIPKQITDLVQSTEKEQESYSIRRGDVFVTRTSETSDELGMSCVALKDYPMATYNGFTKRMRPITNRVFPEYIGYYMRLPSFRGEFRAFSTMTTRASLRNEDLLGLEVKLPSIEIQKQIADILSAYDDLIENNQKQIKLLEEAAQRLYKEWFVDLRFPGHENTEIVDGVPEGWNECTVESFGTVITGKTPPTSNKEYYTNGKVPFVTIPDMHNVVYPLKTEKRLTIEGAQTQKNKYIPPNSVMISCIGTVGLVSIATEVCQTNQQINSIILNNEDDLYFFYESMLRMKDLLDGLGSNGATMTNVNKSKLEKLIIISPSKDIVKQYNDVCKPLFESALNSSRKNVYLKNMREALLPKLMSGEVEV